jgi:hypothetical protein
METCRRHAKNCIKIREHPESNDVEAKMKLAPFNSLRNCRQRQLGDGRLGAKDAFAFVFLVPPVTRHHMCAMTHQIFADRIIKAYLTFTSSAVPVM